LTNLILTPQATTLLKLFFGEVLNNNSSDSF